MQQFEAEIAKAFLLFRLDWFVGEAIKHSQAEGKADYKWGGLYTFDRRSFGLPEPPDGIKHVIDSLQAPTWLAYANQVKDVVNEQNGRLIFTLLIAAFEGRLDRLGFSDRDMLGAKVQKIHDTERQRGSPTHPMIEGGILEILNRRNDLVHANGLVREVSTDKHLKIEQSWWITHHGWPTQGTQHKFDLEYLYNAANVLLFYGKNI